MLKTNFLGLKLKNPTVLASGIMGMNENSLERCVDAGAGMVTTKSIGPEYRKGHKNPSVIELEHGFLNAVGLPTPGYKETNDEWEELKKFSVPVIASIYGGTIKEFVKVAEFITEKKPAIIELNISCPNSDKHGMLFGTEPKIAGEVVAEVKKVTKKIPIMPKLTPNTHLLKQVAKECEAQGANAISAINTVAGMKINIEARKPVLSFKKGGYSGPAIKPIAVKAIYDLYEELEIPILGMGGVTTGKDAIELIQAGATIIGIGTGVYYREVEVFEKVCNEMKQWMNQNNVKKISELIGVAHE